jgi:hypothetical protein
MARFYDPDNVVDPVDLNDLDGYDFLDNIAEEFDRECKKVPDVDVVDEEDADHEESDQE